ncbi:UNVERIFIED_CONTAM: hypothetical protein NCL1_47691 [Trichonephila clavipes]
MTVLLENNVPVLLTKSVCDLCPLVWRRTFGTFSLVLLDFFSKFQRKIEKSLKVGMLFNEPFYQGDHTSFTEIELSRYVKNCSGLQFFLLYTVLFRGSHLEYYNFI